MSAITLSSVPSPEEQEEYFSGTVSDEWLLQVRVREGHEQEDFSSFVERFIGRRRLEESLKEKSNETSCV